MTPKMHFLKGLPICSGKHGFSSSSKLKFLSYRRLPTERILCLSVAKLDGSLFEVQVAKTASVWELKVAVEEVTSYGERNIGRPNVWGYFCLCHHGKKLINDKLPLQTFGIKDGDQLQFARHLTIN